MRTTAFLAGGEQVPLITLGSDVGLTIRPPITDYFRRDVLPKRSYLRLEWCLAVLKMPIRREVQSDGRIRHWGYVPELGKYLRVVTLEDGMTIHNAFPDRRFKP